MSTHDSLNRLEESNEDSRQQTTIIMAIVLGLLAGILGMNMLLWFKSIQGMVAVSALAILFGSAPIMKRIRVRQPSTPKSIIVTRRGDDYHACLKDNPRIWGCGKTYHAAIGDLINTHSGTFNVTIT